MEPHWVHAERIPSAEAERGLFGFRHTTRFLKARQAGGLERGQVSRRSYREVLSLGGCVCLTGSVPFAGRSVVRYA